MKSHRLPLLSATLTLAAASLTGPLAAPPCFAGQETSAASAPSGVNVYGLAARLPKDIDGFASFYHLSDLWEGFFKSNFFKKIMSNEMLVKEFDLEGMMREWEKGAEFKQYVTLAASAVGSEVMIAFPAGFTEQFAGILKQMIPMQAAVLSLRMQERAEVVPNAEPGARPGGMPPQMFPIIEAASRIEFPPVIVAFKTGAAKDQLKELIKMALSSIPAEVRSKLDTGTFDVAGGYSFDRLGLKVGKVMPPEVQAEMKRELTRAAGDEKKAEAVVSRILAKTVELSWGWIDDYLVLSFGRDHSHVKFATAADSVLTHPDVAARAAHFASKKPLSFSYSSENAIQTLNGLGGIVDMLIELAGTAKSAGVPFPMDTVVSELKKLDVKADAIWPNDAHAAVAAMWWDGGLRAEGFGGNRPRAFNHSKPLTFGSAASDKTLLLIGARANSAHRDKVFAWLEDVAASVWTVYQTSVKPIMPPDVRQQTAMGEMVALPLVKEFWKSVQAFRAAMGDESALIVNLDGTMPNIPQANLPPEFVAKGKVPRLAWVSELKDRAKLTESWNGIKSIITPLAALAASQTGLDLKTEPITKKEGDVELFGFELPIDTGDAWPHTAIGGNRWFFGTSPSFTVELAGKTPAAQGPACGTHARINFNALWAFADTWRSLLPAGAQEKEHIDFVLSLLRALDGIELRCGEENGQAHDTFHFSIKDVK